MPTFATMYLTVAVLKLEALPLQICTPNHMCRLQQ